MKKLLALSVTLNLALACWLGLTRFSHDQLQVPARIESPHLPALQATAPVDTSLVMEAYGSMVTKGLGTVESRQWLAARLVAEADAAGASNYWQPKSVRDATARIRRYDSLRTIRASLRDKLGPDVAADPSFAAIFFPNADRWSYLPPAVQQSLEQILMEDLRKRMGSPQSFGAPKYSAQTDADIRNLMSAEQYFEYSLRESALSEQLLASGFDFNEKEFRGVFSAWNTKAPANADGKAQMPLVLSSGMSDGDPLMQEIRAVLGEERYSDYVKVHDPVFKMIEAAAALYPASVEKRDQAYAVIRDTKEKARSLLAGGPVIGAQAHQALTKLKLERARNLAVILGGPAAELLERSMGPMDSLDVGIGLMPVVAR